MTIIGLYTLAPRDLLINENGQHKLFDEYGNLCHQSYATSTKVEVGDKYIPIQDLVAAYKHWNSKNSA